MKLWCIHLPQNNESTSRLVLTTKCEVYYARTIPLVGVGNSIELAIVIKLHCGLTHFHKYRIQRPLQPLCG